MMAAFIYYALALVLLLRSRAKAESAAFVLLGRLPSHRIKN